MYTLDEQVNALATAASYLEPAGMLVFDVFYPKFEAIAGGIGQEILELEWPRPSDPTKVVRRDFRNESFDKINQTFRLTFVFRTFQGSKLVSEEAESLTLSYYTYPHLRALFRLADLEPLREYGSFAKTPLDNSAEEMIFLLRKNLFLD
jgi:hypothetical protein